MYAASHRPILVTGSFRSGTTWVGRMLACHAQVAYVSEPLNVRRPPSPVRHFFSYVTATDQGPFRDYLRPLLSFTDPALYQLTNSVPKRWLCAAARIIRCGWRRLRRCRPLLKDPTAFFAAEWLEQTFGMAVVVLIRHPAAFASSMKRLGWRFDFGDFLAQPELLHAYLGEFHEEIHRAARRPPDLIDQAILLWRIFHSVILGYQQIHPDWVFARHEDLSTRPQEEFAQLFRRLDLTMTPGVRRTIQKFSAASNPREAPAGVVHQLRRDSAANVWSWVERLSRREIHRIRRQTADIAECFYSAADWQPPLRNEHLHERKPALDRSRPSPNGAGAKVTVGSR